MYITTSTIWLWLFNKSAKTIFQRFSLLLCNFWHSKPSFREIGNTNFFAKCSIINTSMSTADGTLPEMFGTRLDQCFPPKENICYISFFLTQKTRLSSCYLWFIAREERSFVAKKRSECFLNTMLVFIIFRFHS